MMMARIKLETKKIFVHPRLEGVVAVLPTEKFCTARESNVHFAQP
jgi:hypothetical protein